MGFLVVAIIAGLVFIIAGLVALLNKNDEDAREGAGITSIIALVVTIVVIVWGSIAIIPNGHIAVMVRFQKVTGNVLNAGFNWKSMIDSPVVMSIQTQKYEVDCEAASKDLQDVTSKIAVNYKLDSNKAIEIYKTIGLNYFEVVGHPSIQEVVKAITAQYNAEEMITKREIVKSSIAEALKNRLAERGIISEAINITNFSFSDEFTIAIEAKVSAAQKVFEAQNKLEQIKVEAEQAKAKAEGDKQAAILGAEGKKQSAILTAEGEAQAIQIVTESQVAANEKLKSSLTPEVLQYIFIDRMGEEVQVWVVPEDQAFTIAKDNK